MNSGLTQEQKEKAFLVFVNPDDADDRLVEEELEGLVEAAEGEVAGWTRQRIERPYKATYLGKGKVEEVTAAAAELEADFIVVDSELSGIQIRNLEEATERRVIDRTSLILDIFARRARTREGQLQVEYAQLNYRLPRLMSVYTKFERQRGGIGMRGPGETKLESDRRMIQDRLAYLKREIDGVRRHREVQRSGRARQDHPSVSLVGYTSAGKSTLMNAMCGTDLLADAMPFATLDPTTRQVNFADGYSFFLTDTVGFIRQLPTFLVAAFRATLEEVKQADLLLHIIDLADPAWETHRDTVLDTLKQLDADEVPRLTVFNKIDQVDRSEVTRAVAEWAPAVAVSALKGEGLEELQHRILEALRSRLTRITALLPYDQTGLVEGCYRHGQVKTLDYRDDGIYIEAELDAAHSARVRPYAVAEEE